MGNTSIMHQLAELNPDMLGFIFYPESPRFFMGKIQPYEIEKIPESIKKVGVFVNVCQDEIHKYCKLFHLDTAQLHGKESPWYCSTIKETGLTVIKALTLIDEPDHTFTEYEDCCDYLLFDTPTEQHGGSGKKFNWEHLNNYTGKLPFLLSGGIGKEDAETVKNINHPKFAGIDINSRFEDEPGIKNVQMIESFLNELK